MTVKEQILKMVQDLPEDATIEDSIDRLCLWLKIQKAEAQIRSGQVISHEEAQKADSAMAERIVKRVEKHLMNPLLQRISINPNVCFGKPCIRGTRIWVSLILDVLASGMSIPEVLAEYPQLTEEDIRAAIAYGAEMSRQHYVDIPTEANES